MRKYGQLALAAAGVVWVIGSAGAAARTVNVASFDGTTGDYSLTLGAGDPGLICVVGDQTDKGASFDAGWALTNCLGSVTNNQPSFSGRLPAAVRGAAKKIRFFAVSHPAGNPVTYIQSGAKSDGSAGSWIDTGYLPVQGVKFAGRMRIANNCVPYGYTSWIYFFFNSTSGFSAYFKGTGSFTAPSGLSGDFHTYEQSSDGAFIDGSRVADAYSLQSTTFTRTLGLFCRWSTTVTGATQNKMGVTSIARFKISEGSEVKRDFIAWKKPDGTGCMLDQNSGTVYDNQNTTYPFTCGGDLDHDLTASYMTYSTGSAVQSISGGVSATVSGVTLTQDATSHRVTVGYTLGTTPAGARAIVTAQILVGGKPVNGQHVVGDVNLELAAGAHAFHWLPDLDVPGVDMRSVTVNVEAWQTNAPPAYIAFDMRWQAGELNHPPRYFNSTNELAGTIDSDVWRTDYLLMRRINAAGALFRMGKPEDSVNVTRYVTFTNDYYIGVFELTQGQFVNCVTNLTNPSKCHVSAGDERWRTCPLEYISVANFRVGGSGGNNVWPHYGRDVVTLKTKPLTMMRLCTGAMLDLPTEAQWEFACRAGTGSEYYNGTDSFADAQSRNMNNPSGNNVTTWTEATLPTATIEQGGTARVGSFAPNPWGLYDLYGNVWETCLDQYVANEAFEQNTLATPFVEPPGSGTYTLMSDVKHVRRGGGWGATVSSSGSNYRAGNLCNSPNTGIGYRLVCPVPYGKVW